MRGAPQPERMLDAVVARTDPTMVVGVDLPCECMFFCQQRVVRRAGSVELSVWLCLI